ncbi:MAG TPA: VPLPA-CTERM sorting domain-containing protein [Candidatus Methylomirabilis sp.]|nr:VPLPA-CTERM sorting domain-containing protein [Candidatus Methylomirabilis sp.]
MKNNNRCSWRYLFGQVNLLCVISLVAFANVCPLAANAATLSGAVSFDSNTGLYTYSYILDNTSGLAAIKELSVLVDNSQDKITKAPLSYTTPTGWYLGQAVSGSSADSPLNEFGTFWQWYASQALPTGGTMSGFSFTTSIAPVTGSANNYFLWSNSYTGGPPAIGNGGIVEWGHIVAPDFGATAVVPIPAAVWLFGSGLLGLIRVARRKSKMAH